MMPSCDHTGVPIHFHSSTTSGSACWISLRILPRVFPRQSPSEAILSEISADAGWPWLAPDFFMFSDPDVAGRGSCAALVPGIQRSARLDFGDPRLPLLGEQSELLLEVYWLVIHERLLFPRTREFHQRVS